MAGLQLLIDGTAVVLDSNGMATFKPTIAGTIIAKAIATDTAGNIGQAIFDVAVIDTSDVNAPNVSLDLGAYAGGLITAPIDIKGSISDDGQLDYYRLLVAPVAGGEFREIAFVDNPTAIANGVLGKFDPSLLQNDSYILRLEVADNGGHISYADEVVDVAGELKLGNFRLSFTDLTVPVTGIPITLTRTYDSLNSGITDDFGYGWRMEFRDTDLRTSLRPPSEDSQLVGYQNSFKDGTKVYITLPGGKREAFTFKPKQVEQVDGSSLLYFSKYFYTPEFVADKGVTSTLSVESNFITKQQDSDQFYGFQGNPYNPADPLFGAKYKLTTKEGVVYEIDAQTGDLLTVTDTNGNKLTYTDADITSSTGQKITFGRDAQGRIATVTDPTGKQIRYEYDAKGDLISVTDREGNTTRIEYDQQRSHYLDKIIDPLGKTGVRNEYGDDGRLKKMVDAAGASVQLAYDPSHSTETITDALGHPTTYEYDERGNVVTEIDALGGIITRDYDQDNNLLTKVDADGVSTSFTYDANRNKLTEINPLGNVTRYTYNNFGQVLTKINPLGHMTTHEYDSNGNLLVTINAIGSTKQTYNEFGNITEIIDGEGQATRFEYDSIGRVTRQVDALGNATTYTYDSNGNQLSQTSTITTINGKQLQTKSWTYDAEGRVTSEIDPLSNIVRYEYDKMGHQTFSIEQNMDNRRTEYEYDDKGQLVKTLYADGTSESSVYDGVGRNITTIDAGGQATHFVYDALGHLIETIYPDNTANNLNDNPHTQAEYDKAGRVNAFIDELGNRTEYKYDAAGRRILVRDALGNETKYTYDTAGHQLSETNARNYTTKFVYDNWDRPIETDFADGTHTTTTYDDVGRRSSIIDQAGHTTYFSYDALNRLVEVIYPDDTPEDISNNPRAKTEYNEAGWVTARIDELGNREEYEYDAAGRLVESRSDCRCRRKTYTYDAAGNTITETDPLGHTTEFFYDKLDRLIQTYFDDGSNAFTTYDALGRTVGETDSSGKTTKFEYDSRGRLTAVVDALKQRTEYSYDLTGNKIQVLDANNHITQYEYDALDRRTTTILPMGQRSSTSYDSVGNVASTTDFNGNIITYEYDALNQIAAKRFSDTTAIEYTYTPTGQVKAIQDQQGIANYKYDVRDRLVERDDPDGQFIRYTYDPTSNRTAVITSTGTTTYTYDKYNELATVTDPNGGLTRYTYDKAGNVTRTEMPNGTVETRQYDDLNRLVYLENTGNVGTISSYRYTLDAAGNRTAVVDNTARRVDYTYDDLYRLTQEKITDSTAGNRTIDYTYDVVGDRLDRNDSVQGLTTYAYDNNDRLLNETLNGQVTSYTYDKNGNTLSRIKNATDQVFYDWDYENHLIEASVTSSTGTVHTQYKYNGDGIRVAEIVDGQETRYLIDANRPYAEVLSEYTPDGTVQASYVYGRNLISQNRGGVSEFYEKDGLGSTSALTDASGHVTDTYTYDAYGNLLGSTGTTINNYLYTGEQYESNLGEYYLRARYYDPSVGRFSARDPFEGIMTEPLSLTKYPYAHGNPVNGTDKSGMFVDQDITIADVISSILDRISPISPLIRVIGRTAGTIGATIATVVIAHQVNLALSKERIRECTLTGDEDCEAGIPIVFYGQKFNGMPLENTTSHIGNAIKGGKPQVLSAWAVAPADHGKRDWYKNKPQCNNPARGKYVKAAQKQGIRIATDKLTCDEYPFYQSEEGGRTNYDAGMGSLQLVPSSEAGPQGILMNDSQLKDAGVVKGDPFFKWYGVIPFPDSPQSFWRKANINSIFG
ncbi:RHS repeat-associated core domain-containing protein [Nostoc sp.]|uniref:RHS repeat-associated core domain-containing protein n=1 Tax=Nostoc sp. TaxID=1180 RepID=UPI002FFD11B2